MYLTYLFGESGDFISLELWTSIFTLCNLVILFFVMKKLLFKPVKKMIDSRQQEVDDMYANANQDKEAAAQMKTEYEEKLAKASERALNSPVMKKSAEENYEILAWLPPSEADAFLQSEFDFYRDLSMSMGLHYTQRPKK